MHPVSICLGTLTDSCEVRQGALLNEAKTTKQIFCLRIVAKMFFAPFGRLVECAVLSVLPQSSSRKSSGFDGNKYPILARFGIFLPNITTRSEGVYSWKC